MRNPILIAAALVACAGCVTQGKYDSAVQSGDSARAKLRNEMALDAAAAKERDALRTSLDEEKSLTSQLRASLASANENGMSLAADKGSLTTALERTRRAELIANARVIFYRQIALKLKSMIDAGELSVVIRDGRMVLELPADVIFASGQADVQPHALATLKQIANVLKTLPKQAFQVAGHTDNLPIETAKFRSNWELSSARALEVTRLLITDGMIPGALSAAAYGDNDPVATNADAKGRAKNRRIEITVEPNIDELVWIPDFK